MATNFATPAWRAPSMSGAHDKVVVEEPARIVPIGADASDDRGQVDDQVRAGLGEHPRDVRFLAQVVLATAGDEGLGATALAERLDDERPEEAPRRPLRRRLFDGDR